MENLKLSIVVATRGDYYGGDNVAKTLRLIKEIKRKLYKLDEVSFEILVVDYNFNPVRRIKSFLPFEESNRVRIIEVPNRSLRSWVSKDVPFIEFHAKNIGIRNAVGEQILVLNNDVRFSTPLLESCLRRPFHSDSFLRADRLDISMSKYFRPKFILNSRGGEQASDRLQHRIWEREFFTGSKLISNEEQIHNFHVTPKGGISDHYIFGGHGNAAGDFICAPKKAWHQIKGYQERKYERFMGDSFLISGFFQIGLRQMILPGPGKLIHFDHYRPIDHRINWSADDWVNFVDEFRMVAAGEKDYKLREEEWGNFIFA